MGRTVGTRNESTRAAWIAKTLGALEPGGRILDAGAGERPFAPLCAHLDYVSQDFAQYDGAGDGSGLQMGSWQQGGLDIVGDITGIPEPDSSFDAVMCTEVLEHVPSPQIAIHEFARLLRPGGKLVLTAPFASLTHFAPFHFASGFNHYFYEHHLADSGFDVEEIGANGNYFEFLAQELRRVTSVGDRYANLRTSRIERFSLRVILRMLEHFSECDSGSSELLCFGYHVLATRRG